MFGVLTLVLVFITSTTDGLTVDCDTFNPAICTPDANRYCFSDGTVVISDCTAKQKLCDKSDTSTIDETWNACRTTESSTTTTATTATTYGGGSGGGETTTACRSAIAFMWIFGYLITIFTT
ncbi:uncharacterized protein LOC121382983 [Gigantopelta aegis]|uniref:uncharacterized protein LOC121382983 n=1 Tax=Gigantopelta aegis TaxID=1735272 RepID=UPI001B88E62F|nr:uncharacterized protein LOC121382983 [Gigantopelta aegis]